VKVCIRSLEFSTGLRVDSSSLVSLTGLKRAYEILQLGVSLCPLRRDVEEGLKLML
jgi:hypothetical protein